MCLTVSSGQYVTRHLKRRNGALKAWKVVCVNGAGEMCSLHMGAAMRPGSLWPKEPWAVGDYEKNWRCTRTVDTGAIHAWTRKADADAMAEALNEAKAIHWAGAVAVVVPVLVPATVRQEYGTANLFLFGYEVDFSRRPSVAAEVMYLRHVDYVDAVNKGVRMCEERMAA